LKARCFLSLDKGFDAVGNLIAHFAEFRQLLFGSADKCCRVVEAPILADATPWIDRAFGLRIATDSDEIPQINLLIKIFFDQAFGTMPGGD